jgi:hypothetical protein
MPPMKKPAVLQHPAQITNRDAGAAFVVLDPGDRFASATAAQRFQK